MFFRAKKGPKLKDQKVRDQVSTTFSEAPNKGLTVCERISLVAYVILALFQLYCDFFHARIHFFEFGPVFGCHAALKLKNQLDIRKVQFMLKISKKKFSKNLQEQKSSPDPENFQSSDQQAFNFFPVFAVFRTLPDGSGTPKVFEGKQKKMMEVKKKKSGRYLKWNGLYRRSKKSLFRHICLSNSVIRLVVKFC